VIAAGQYGAGTVMVWDGGHYEPQGGATAEQLARGKIDVVLHGDKLRGGFTLVRTGKAPSIRAKADAGCWSSSATRTPIRHDAEECLDSTWETTEDKSCEACFWLTDQQ
jgi:hypothetical protein